jgi:hypothetical protein
MPSEKHGTGRIRAKRVLAAAVVMIGVVPGATAHGSPGERDERASSARARAPQLSRASCLRSCGANSAVRPGSLLLVRGRGLGAVTRVIFHGASGSADDRSARVRRRADGFVHVLVPADAVTGRLSVTGAGCTRSALGPRVAIVRSRSQRPPSAPGAPLVATPGYANVRYVSPAGNDRGPGTKACPWATVGKALATVGADTRILVRKGTYVERIEAAAKGRAGDDISLEAHPGERVVLHVQLLLRNATHVRVRGFLFDGQGMSGTAIRIDSGSFVELFGNEIRNYRRTDSSQAVLLDKDTFRPSIVANHIHDTGIWDQHDHGVYCKNAKGAYIANNVIHDLDKGAGIHLYSGDGTGCDGSIVTANTIVASQTSGIIISRGSDANVVTGNLIAGHAGTESGTFGAAVLEREGIGQGNVVRNNLGHANAKAEDFSCPSCAAVSGNVTADPGFLSMAARDFRLSPGSPAADRAVPADAPRTDREGTPRPQGAASDIGAYELVVR